MFVVVLEDFVFMFIFFANSSLVYLCLYWLHLLPYGLYDGRLADGGFGGYAIFSAASSDSLDRIVRFGRGLMNRSG